MNTFFFRTNNKVKSLVKTFQCATAYLPTHSLNSPGFLVPATLDDEGKNANFPSTPPHCRRIIHECSWKPVGHGTHFKPFITSRVPTFLSICLSVCLSDVVNGVVESYSYIVLCASYFGLVQPNEPKGQPFIFLHLSDVRGKRSSGASEFTNKLLINWLSNTSSQL